MNPLSNIDMLIQLSKKLFNLIDKAKKKTISETRSKNVGETEIKKCPFIRIDDMSGVSDETNDGKDYDEQNTVESKLSNCLNEKCQLWISTSPLKNSIGLTNNDEFLMITGYPLERGSIILPQISSDGNSKIPNGRCGLQTADFAELTFRLTHHLHMSHKHNISHDSYQTTNDYLVEPPKNYPYMSNPRTKSQDLISECMLNEDTDGDGKIYGKDFTIVDSQNKPEPLKQFDQMGSSNPQPYHVVTWDDYTSGKFLPFIKSLTPSYGHKSGGTYIEIIGGFFDGNMDLFNVKVNNIPVTEYTVKRDGRILYIKTPEYTGTSLTKKGDTVDVSIQIETFGNTFRLKGTKGHNANIDGENGHYGTGGKKTFSKIFKYTYDNPLLIDSTYANNQHIIKNARSMAIINSTTFLNVYPTIESGYVVEFSDPIVEYLIKDNLANKLNDVKEGAIYRKELSKVDIIDATSLPQELIGETISSLTTINACTGLKTLKLNDIMFESENDKNLNFLTSCSKLENINVSNCNLLSINGLVNKNVLYNVDISDNPDISDITSLSNSLKLIALNISNTTLSDISVLSNFKYLQVLRINDDSGLMSINNFSSIFELKSLYLLELDNQTNFSQVNFLQLDEGTLKYLRYLSLNNCGLSDLSPLLELKRLKEVSILDNSSLYDPEITGLKEANLAIIDELTLNGVTITHNIPT